ncbi:MAG: hypothetical protein BWX96_00661 [Bacteroidetes bacterium ADurb.Bin145]|nr:MAG: hypothetical protein BWX96_00661 [Bacteroidetes bacterium ADurb.Bin145]
MYFNETNKIQKTIPTNHNALIRCKAMRGSEMGRRSLP